MAEEARHRPDVVRRYEGADLTVVWEPAFCIHAGHCFRRLPQVFDPMARPWVKPGAASTEQLVDAVLACPTGALSFQENGSEESPDGSQATIEPRPNGPLFVRGAVEVVDGRGNVLRRANRIALCRCGQSKHKPYCDLSHRAAGFTT